MATLNVRFMDTDEVRVINRDEIQTIEDLKSHIEQYHGVPSEDQIYVQKNEILYNAIRLDFLEILPAELQLYKKVSYHESITVEVTPKLADGTCLPDLVLLISGGKSVSDLELMIEKELAVPPPRQCLWSMGIQMQSNLLLREYIVSKPAKFYVKLGINEDRSDK